MYAEQRQRQNCVTIVLYVFISGCIFVMANAGVTSQIIIRLNVKAVSSQGLNIARVLSIDFKARR